MRRLLLALALLLPGSAGAETWPDKAVRIIVPFPPGGAAYVSPFLLGKRFGEVLGQNFVIDPRPGGSTVIAGAAVMNSKPDGYTLLAASNSAMSVIQHLLVGKLPYDPEKAFAPIGLISRFPFYLCVPTSLPVKSVAELIALAKQKPGQLNYASNGNGTVGHIAMEMVKRATGIEISHIPYKSYTQALPDLLSGQVSTMMCDLSVTGAQIQAGNLRLLAVTTAQRSRDFPDVPTMAEVGFPQVVQARRHHARLSGDRRRRARVQEHRPAGVVRAARRGARDDQGRIPTLRRDHPRREHPGRMSAAANRRIDHSAGRTTW